MLSSCLSLMVAMSLHVGMEGDYQSVHPHARCDVDNKIAGVYYNSEKSLSAYLGYKFDMPFDSDLEVGLVTGYTGVKVAPMVRLVKDNWYITPAYETSNGGNWGIAVGYEFKLF
jgi:hypothetical protein